MPEDRSARLGEAEDPFKISILRREVDELQVVVQALVWFITGAILLAATVSFLLFWFVRK